MALTALYLENIPWKKIGAFALVILFCGMAFYKESFLVGDSEKQYFNRLGKQSRTRLSGRTIVAILGGMLVVISFLFAYIFYTTN